jgi:hypothetical protein
MKMSLGEKAILRITSDYGYGAAGAGDLQSRLVIPPNADLVFEVAESKKKRTREYGGEFPETRGWGVGGGGVRIKAGAQMHEQSQLACANEC